MQTMLQWRNFTGWNVFFAFLFLFVEKIYDKNVDFVLLLKCLNDKKEDCFLWII